MKLEDGGYPELKSDLKQFLNSGKWQLELQSGQQLPEKVTMGVTVKAWGVANSLTGFTAISFCGLYLSIIFIILISIPPLCGGTNSDERFHFPLHCAIIVSRSYTTKHGRRSCRNLSRFKTAF